MEVKSHAISAVPLAAVCYTLGLDLKHIAVAILVTLIVDFDHVLDFVILKRRYAPLREITRAFEDFQIISKNFFWLHSWELAIAAGLAAWRLAAPFWLAVFLGYCTHLLCDQVYNINCLGKYNLKPAFYFLIYRFIKKFDVLRLRQKGDQIEPHERIYT